MKVRVVKVYVALFFCLVLCHASAWGQPSIDSVNLAIATTILENFTQGGHHDATYQTLRKDPSLGPRLRSFENTVIAVYESLTISPRLVNPGPDLATALRIPKEFGAPLILFYDLTNDYNLNGFSNRLILAQTRRGLYFHKHRKRLTYYRENITRRSVSQMAQDLGINENDIYQQLWRMDISIEDIWDTTRLPDGSRLMDRVQSLLDQGHSVDLIADTFGLGKQALKNIFTTKGFFQ